jgi:hypothetical protein
VVSGQSPAVYRQLDWRWPLIFFGLDFRMARSAPTGRRVETILDERGLTGGVAGLAARLRKKGNNLNRLLPFRSIATAKKASVSIAPFMVQ